MPGEKIPDEDGEDEEKKEEELKRKKEEKKPVVLDNIEVVRGAVGFDRGVHRWEFMWKHDPYWNGKGDAVGICTWCSRGEHINSLVSLIVLTHSQRNHGESFKYSNTKK